LIKTKTTAVKEEIKRNFRSGKNHPRMVVKTRRAKVYLVNPDFEVLPELKDLVMKVSVASRKKLLDKIQRLGKIKLALLSGIFLRNDNSRTDLLLVGEKIKRGKLDKFISQIESEIGKAIRYTIMDTTEFKYRLDMYDRFLRDILESPHEKLVDRLKI